MTPAEAAAEIRKAAVTFGSGETTIQDFWGAFHEHLYDLCVEHPLDGDWLEAFHEMESWELATGTDREAAVERTRVVARRLAVRA